MKPGDPILMLDGQWALVEKISNEYHQGYDDFVDILTLRWTGGHQSRATTRELKIVRVQGFLYRHDSWIYAQGKEP